MIMTGDWRRLHR